MTKAIFPGTFDPIHYGHIDIAMRAAGLFDGLVVAVYDLPLKNIIFSTDDRLRMVRKAFEGAVGITVAPYSGLTVEYCRQIGARVIIRGLRVFSDFEHEFRMAHANKRLAEEIEYMTLITAEEHTFLSSSIVREIASLGGDVSSMVPDHVRQALEEHFRASEDGKDGRHFKSLRD
ncbi:MAG TPA: pantetheine-phosphate adenylyltransferase [Anaerolineales bacterium]|nr:pantetheine-phosphate adenylyltransferase [Anaerolineales bacterium]